MANKKENEIEIVTGLEEAENPKQAEYDLVASLLKAAEYREDPDLIQPVDIKRNGVYLFTVHLRPIGEEEVSKARKKATTYMPNPQNRKLPPVRKSFDDTLFNSLIIYAGTTDEDKKKIWGNQAVLDKYNLMQPHESIDVLLTLGEKTELSDLVIQISGMDVDDEEVSKDEYIKN